MAKKKKYLKKKKKNWKASFLISTTGKG